MHARDDDYVFAHHAIEYRVRKASNETPPSVPVTHGIACGVRLDGAQGGPYRIEELVAQPGSLLSYQRYAASTSAAAAGRRTTITRNYESGGLPRPTEFP